jgi:hypothetical protein
MNSIDWNALLAFFFDPSVGCCCCIPIVGLVSAAGLAMAKRTGRLPESIRAWPGREVQSAAINDWIES